MFPVFSVVPFAPDPSRLAQINVAVVCDITLEQIIHRKWSLEVSGHCELVHLQVCKVSEALAVSEISADIMAPNAWWLRGELAGTGERVGVFVTPSRLELCYMVYGFREEVPVETGLLVGKATEEEVRRSRALIASLNVLGANPCPTCRQPFGFSTKVWECEDPRHQIVAEILRLASDVLHLGCCDRCGTLSDNRSEMVVGQSHIAFSDYIKGPLEFCGHCHSILYAD